MERYLLRTFLKYRISKNLLKLSLNEFLEDGNIEIFIRCLLYLSTRFDKKEQSV